jgi:hypothetical protein
MRGVVFDLQQRAAVHDQSKLGDIEKPVFDAVTVKLRELDYGSPEYKAALEEMGPALDHHYAANDHHPEHFPGGIYEMDLLQLTEMLVDWIAAGRRHSPPNDIHNSIRQNAERFGYQRNRYFEQLLHRTADTILGLEPNE